MEIIFLMIAISILMALIFLGAFLWSVKTGQFDDEVTPSIRILFDDNDSEQKPNNK
ncbi:cbb3-type cytochrome oxidase assembly protein CcoS [Hyphobacterium sp. CCMP332]|nr:cbb3-type cytochrome oxidase assembly protein CcoS [Hyphobacterium sp. CCMP332]